MSLKKEIEKLAKKFKEDNNLDRIIANIVPTLHLINRHGLDTDTALDQTCVGSSDFGIDAWFYNKLKRQLIIYQSKYSEARQTVIKGFYDYFKANNWLEQALINGQLLKQPENHGLINLWKTISEFRDEINTVDYVVLSLINKDLSEDLPSTFYDLYIKTKIYEKFRLNINSKIYHTELSVNTYSEIKKYEIPSNTNRQIELAKNKYLSISYLNLYDLVQIYRERGDVLFHKNVRLSLIKTKEAKNLVVNPMVETFEKICSGTLPPEIFPFYHVGLTISANNNKASNMKSYILEKPNVVNGCQTITIANSFLNKLEKFRSKNKDKIEKFKKIEVIAKVVIGTDDDTLREITNSNNRQNPIQNWQLYSNDVIHIRIEDKLKDFGVFYERQKGKYASLKDKRMNIDGEKSFNDIYYNCKPNAFVKVEELAKITCLSKKELDWLQLAAKPSNIFINNDTHNKVFDEDIPKYQKDIVLLMNILKSCNRAYSLKVDNPKLIIDEFKIFKKPIVKTYFQWIAFLFYYNKERKEIREFSKTLYKNANTRLVQLFEKLYKKIAIKFKEFYLNELNIAQKQKGIDSKIIERYVTETLLIEIGINIKDCIFPMTEQSLNLHENLMFDNDESFDYDDENNEEF